MKIVLNQNHYFRFFFLLGFLFCSISYGQEPLCGNCSFTTTYNGNPGSATNPTKIGNNSWSSNYPTLSGIARFNRVGYYLWEASGNNPVKIGGFVLEDGVNLEIGRQNNNETPAFDIEGGCIVVRSGATLNFSYYTKLKGVSICVENGGKVIFDSEAAGNSSGQRDDFVFEDIEIILAPNAEIKFGNAEIVQLGYIVLQGYSGTGCILNQDGSLTPPSSPPANIDVDLSRMSQQELVIFCNFLSNAGFGILPVDYKYINVVYQQNRINLINWATSKEWENSHFEVERSINGISNWEKIGEVQGMGWTDEVTEYSFCDEKLPLGGGSVFYRLKQVDFNLQFEYSKTVSVKVPALQVTKGKWRVYPNPVNDVNFYIARTEMEEISSIEVKVLASLNQVRSIAVANERELTEVVKKGFEKLPKGVFVIEIQWNQKVEYLKVIKN